MSEYGSNDMLKAKMLQLGDDLFRAEYLGAANPSDPAQGQEMPDFHLGTNVEEVRGWVEQMARSMGYRGVTWN